MEGALVEVVEKSNTGMCLCTCWNLFMMMYGHTKYDIVSQSSNNHVLNTIISDKSCYLQSNISHIFMKLKFPTFEVPI